MRFKHTSGFTLLEILLVVAAVGILAAIVIVAINPNEQLAKVRNAERQSEVNALYDAIQQYNIDNNGEYPSEITNLSDNEAAEICEDGTSDPSCINLTDDLTETYISNIPSDPQSSGPGSGYVVSKEGSRIRIEASNVELENEIIAAGYDSTRLLDDYPFAAAAYSIRLLNDSYETTTAESNNDSAGTYLVRIRKDNTDNDTADVLPDSNGELSKDSTVQNTTDSSDGQTLDTWVGSNNAYVTTWYDQSGNSNDATQTTKAGQPQIVNSGSVVKENGKPAVDFDGSDDSLIAFTNDPSYLSLFVVGSSRDKSTEMQWFTYYHNSSENGYAITFNHAGDNRLGCLAWAGSVQTTFGADDSEDITDNQSLLLSAFVDYPSQTADSYINGSLGTKTYDSRRKDNESNLVLGQRNEGNTTYPLDGTFQEMIIYNSDQSSNRTDIESDINKYFGIF